MLAGLLSAQIAGVNARIDDVHARIDDMHADLTARIDRIDDQIDGSDARIGRIETRLDGLDERLRYVEIAFGKADQRLLTLERRHPDAAGARPVTGRNLPFSEPVDTATTTVLLPAGLRPPRSRPAFAASDLHQNLVDVETAPRRPRHPRCDSSAPCSTPT